MDTDLKREGERGVWYRSEKEGGKELIFLLMVPNITYHM